MDYTSRLSIKKSLSGKQVGRSGSAAPGTTRLERAAALEHLEDLYLKSNAGIWRRQSCRSRVVSLAPAHREATQHAPLHSPPRAKQVGRSGSSGRRAASSPRDEPGPWSSWSDDPQPETAKQVGRSGSAAPGTTRLERAAALEDAARRVRTSPASLAIRTIWCHLTEWECRPRHHAPRARGRARGCRAQGAHLSYLCTKWL